MSLPTIAEDSVWSQSGASTVKQLAASGSFHFSSDTLSLMDTYSGNKAFEGMLKAHSSRISKISKTPGSWTSTGRVDHRKVGDGTLIRLRSAPSEPDGGTPIVSVYTFDGSGVAKRKEENFCHKGYPRFEDP
jgi:hypothetical protein